MPEVLYNNELHEYTIDGKVVPSVTQLVKKFLKLDTSWLEAHPEYAERGTRIHNELADYFRGLSEVKDLSEDAYTLAAYVGTPDTACIQSEVLLWNVTNGYAGTADLVKINKNKGIDWIVDFKTGEHLNKKYCRVQLSLYRLALIDMGLDAKDANLLVINPNGVSNFEPMSWEQIEALLKDDFVPDEDQAKQLSRLESRLNMLRPFKDEYDELEKQLRTLMLEMFEKTNTSKYSSSEYAFSYAPASVRKSLDTTRVKETLGDRVEDFMKETTIAATVRIKPINNEEK